MSVPGRARIRDRTASSPRPLSASQYSPRWAFRFSRGGIRPAGHGRSARAIVVDRAAARNSGQAQARSVRWSSMPASALQSSVSSATPPRKTGRASRAASLLRDSRPRASHRRTRSCSFGFAVGGRGRIARTIQRIAPGPARVELRTWGRSATISSARSMRSRSRGVDRDRGDAVGSAWPGRAHGLSRRPATARDCHPPDARHQAALDFLAAAARCRALSARRSCARRITLGSYGTTGRLVPRPSKGVDRSRERHRVAGDGHDGHAGARSAALPERIATGARVPGE